MRSDQVERAVDAATALLATLPGSFVYHDVEHTVEIVLPAAERYAAAEGLDERTCGLVAVAAAFHDTGFIERYRGHEVVSARLAERALRPLEFTGAEVLAVRGMILATRLPQTPHNVAEQVLADADLDTLGREDFPEYNRRLREELALQGWAQSDTAWLEGQIAFLEGHRYFTAAAREERSRQQGANLAWLRSQVHATGRP